MSTKLLESEWVDVTQYSAGRGNGLRIQLDNYGGSIQLDREGAATLLGALAGWVHASPDLTALAEDARAKVQAAMGVTP